MSLQFEAIYENGALKPERPLPLQDQERVVVTIEPKLSHAKASYGMLAWTGSARDLDELLALDNHP